MSRFYTVYRLSYEKLGNKTALRAALENEFSIINFSFFTLDKTDKKYKLIFLK